MVSGRIIKAYRHTSNTSTQPLQQTTATATAADRDRAGESFRDRQKRSFQQAFDQSINQPSPSTSRQRSPGLNEGYNRDKSADRNIFSQRSSSADNSFRNTSADRNDLKPYNDPTHQMDKIRLKLRLYQDANPPSSNPDDHSGPMINEDLRSNNRQEFQPMRDQEFGPMIDEDFRSNNRQDFQPMGDQDLRSLINFRSNNRRDFQPMRDKDIAPMRNQDLRSKYEDDLRSMRNQGLWPMRDQEDTGSNHTEDEIEAMAAWNNKLRRDRTKSNKKK